MNTMTMSFDSLQYAKKLQQAGFTTEQAEVQAEVFQERTNAINSWIDENLATKQDLKLGLETLEMRINSRFSEMNSQLTLRIGGMIAAAVATLGVLIHLMTSS